MHKKIFYCLKCIVIRFIKDDIMALSSQLAYSLIFSFFPFLIFVISIIGYIPLESGDVLTMLNGILPSDILNLIDDTVINIVDTKNSRILFLSLIFTIWTASSGFQAVIRGLNMAYNLEENRSILKLYIVSILCTLGFIVIIFITGVLLVFGRLLGEFLVYRLQLPGEFNFAWNILRYIVMLLAINVIFAAVYKYTPNIKLKWREVILGTCVSTISLVLVSICFAFYVNNFSNYSVIYGSIGAVIVLLTWLFILSNIIIIGGEINAIMYRKR
ncbi:MAG: YihY/virulence factor BrkB family protein [Clostridium sp.]|uniref:YihY/virulence factor BrkB family protein n=1 Tax=Clostridium sp. TaxID=1506 RepID=UPI0025C3E2E5|nr:YihY/virulence factor BrkB family protein [Clostridium sp.]MCH3965864.1 YihY/virulence factor BrkB family protein [Clostridium sp.]MCI1716047.1 YihY/virulence factor BrkB family protein [Clostridium sp.]MCI1800281.1 YihY/virulence factor BrkB family protein [Clostridium sp.]MCI1814224.1 YihY/virulence factor BrkB family protein [Clostridium sp.]MCI1871123.1 YihY/virulence factor BrkB family protein [Clostridium sp.]